LFPSCTSWFFVSSQKENDVSQQKNQTACFKQAKFFWKIVVGKEYAALKIFIQHLITHKTNVTTPCGF
jgi:hypothetical protein